MKRTRLRAPLLALLALLLLAAACGGDDESSGSTTTAEGSAASSTTASTEPVTLRLGYFPNLTHAPALVGVEEGIFEDNLGDNVTLETSTFNAGPEATEALLSGALDITYIGPNPAINAFAQSNGEAIRIIAGSTSGGAFLVVNPEITSATDLAGRTLATPQLGNTQDVALRTYLADEGYETDTAGGGDVSVQPQANGDALTAFIEGNIDGAWVPEPWATRMLQEGGGSVLVDEADLWPNGEFVTTHVIVRTEFLEEHPDVVSQFLKGHIAAVEFTQSNPDEAKAATNAQIEALTTKPIPTEILDAAWENLTFTFDPIASSLATSAEHAESVGLLEAVDLDGIYALDELNLLLAGAGESEVPGL